MYKKSPCLSIESLNYALQRAEKFKNGISISEDELKKMRIFSRSTFYFDAKEYFRNNNDKKGWDYFCEKWPYKDMNWWDYISKPEKE